MVTPDCPWSARGPCRIYVAGGRLTLWRRNSQLAIKPTAEIAADSSAHVNTIESPNVPGGGISGWIFRNAGSPKIKATDIG